MNSTPIGQPVPLTQTFLANGTPTDPTTVSLIVQDPSGAQTTYTYAGAQITRVTTGQYQKAVTPGSTGIWSYEWVATGPAAGTAEGQFEVFDFLAGDSTATPAGNLISVNYYKQFVGMDFADTSQDTNIRTWIGAASTAIQTYTRREFVSAAAPGTVRNFEVRSTGYVPFRRYDLQSTTLVQIDTEAGDTTTSPTTIDVTKYMLLPVDAPDGVYTALKFYSFAVGPILRQVYGISRQVSITGTWGWPVVPADVQRACALTVRDWLVGYSQSFSETLASRMQEEITQARADNIPAPARMLVDHYKKVWV